MFICMFAIVSLSVASAVPLGSYNIDPNYISVSGLSAGGFMAVQMHVAYSDIFRGVGVIAGGPYYCAKGSLNTALTACMSSPIMLYVNPLITATNEAESQGNIDPLTNLKNSPVYLFSGTRDTTVFPGVMDKAQEYYKQYVDPENIMTKFDIAAVHGFPTMNYGGECDRTNNEYINDCDYDAAFEMIQHINGVARVPSYSQLLNVLKFDQTEFVDGGVFGGYSGLEDEGYIFVPDQCADGNTECRLHVSFHGCKQGMEEIDDAYAKKTGLNEVAVTNNMIVLYPQAKKNLIDNPNGCFDWWGYTNKDYAYKSGVQMSAVRKMIERIANV